MTARGMIESSLHRIWYTRSPARFLLAPLALLYCIGVRVRDGLYRQGLLARRRFPVPVIVVGNLVAGGSGKTPLTIELARQFGARGFRVGISASGYGGAGRGSPHAVEPDSDPYRVGDEAVELARRTGCAVSAGADRVASVQRLVAGGCDLILCDDGLQHARLGRDLELVTVDAETGFGNGWCLPAGPLREPVARLRHVDAVIATRGTWPGAVSAGQAVAGVFPLGGADAGARSLADFAGRPVHAVAGIVRPARFFALLKDAGIEVRVHAFPDHHRFRPDDIRFGDGLPVLMTEKDAVKCHSFAPVDAWFVRVDARLPPDFADRLLARLGTPKPSA